jgi:hypothetical protein
MQGLHQTATRDSGMRNLGVLAIRKEGERGSYGEKYLEDGGSVKTKTIQTKGLFNFMEFPAEIRVLVCVPQRVESSTSSLGLSQINDTQY